MLSASVRRKGETPCGKLSELNEVVVDLQLVNRSLRMARAYFKFILNSNLDLEGRLTSDTKIVEHPIFGAGILKVQDVWEAILTTLQNHALSGLLL